MGSQLQTDFVKCQSVKEAEQTIKSNLSPLLQFIPHAEDNKRFPTGLANWLSVHIPTLYGDLLHKLGNKTRAMSYPELLDWAYFLSVKYHLPVFDLFMCG